MISLRPHLLITLTFLLIGLALGGSVGFGRYHRLEEQEALCVSCHHGTSDPAALDEPSHSVNFDAECHACHVLPVKELLSYASISAGADTPPAWVSGMSNPVLGDQTCLECHLARGRGRIDCARCHTDGTTNVAISEHCAGCHVTQEVYAPHDSVDCRTCHFETFLGQKHRVAQAMRRRLDGQPPVEEGAR